MSDIEPERGSASYPRAVDPNTAGRGRPRDVEVDRRIIETARSVYAERGWSGFNFGAVCKAAGVSKDALYRRYRTREDLLAAALDVPPPAIDLAPGGDLRGQLIAIAVQTLEAFSGQGGLIVFRIFVESTANTDLAEMYHHRVAFPHVRYMRDLVRDAIADGTFTAITDSTAFVDGLIGGLMMHVLATPPRKRAAMMADAQAFVRSHVDLMLNGAGYRRD
ncbi:TetR/AcrR family transcriptional regulator [Nocardia sp. NBC_01377]|uniref:TetR/AcrR family transcriptional regulator n=1 Tax=Nocardia sp. NBC_01377 TaxID=2903595 RepID=UPI003251AE27